MSDDVLEEILLRRINSRLGPGEKPVLHSVLQVNESLGNESQEGRKIIPCSTYVELCELEGWDISG